MLTSYCVIYSDGSFRETNCAKNITIEDAREYFLNQWFEQSDEKTMLKCVAVESLNHLRGE